MSFASLFASRTVRIALGILTAVILILLLFKCVRDDAYGDGVRETDARWNAASEKLQDQARNSASAADRNAANRAETFTNQLQAERERMNDAQANGSSPLDALFPSGGM